MKSPLAFALSLCLLPTLLSSQNLLTVGAPAPAIHVSEWIANQPADTSLQGKPMVLEFWATWCGPCIGAVPHLNELQAEFGPRGVQFVSITDDPIATVERTIARVPFASVVVTDLTGATQARFGDGTRLQAFPMTVLVDAAGLVQWVGRPEQLKTTVMTAFLDGSLKGKNYLYDAASAKTGGKGAQAALEESLTAKFSRLTKDRNVLSIFDFGYSKELPGDGVMMNYGMSKRVYSGATLTMLFAKMFGKEVTVPAALQEFTYDLLYIHHRQDTAHLAQAETQLLQTLGLRIIPRGETREFLRVTQVDPTKLAPNGPSMESGMSTSDSQIILSNLTLGNALAAYAEMIGTPVVFDGTDTNLYDLILSITSREELLADLRSYGLEATPEMREVVVYDLVE